MEGRMSLPSGGLSGVRKSRNSTEDHEDCDDKLANHLPPLPFLTDRFQGHLEPPTSTACVGESPQNKGANHMPSAHLSAICPTLLGETPAILGLRGAVWMCRVAVSGGIVLATSGQMPKSGIGRRRRLSDSVPRSDNKACKSVSNRATSRTDP